ncbi:hypothetical protein EVAR_10331_1 [Eumeta japonica]|uniref:Uncharacterized protein n=1 Tax=Eumeta variegata TaxID=151549 RepID=A0A4C1TGZ2_EUMVA|nr:hypothetical protein EVAR_10331_1 [Eumeta japonica]
MSRPLTDKSKEEILNEDSDSESVIDGRSEEGCSDSEIISDCEDPVALDSDANEYVDFDTQASSSESEDRGFRDVVEFLNHKGFNVLMPAFKGNKLQLSTEEANISRNITKIRWVVKAVHVSINETDSSTQRQENERNGTENVTNTVEAPPPKRNKKKNKDDIGVELLNILNKNVELKKAEEHEDRLSLLLVGFPNYGSRPNIEWALPIVPTVRASGQAAGDDD